LKDEDFERKTSNLQKARLTIDGTQEFREITLDERDVKKSQSSRVISFYRFL
jgi:hypothetical protein